MDLELLTFDDVAKIFHKDRKGIKNWLQNGVLPRSLTVKIGRQVFFVAKRLNDFIENQ